MASGRMPEEFFETVAHRVPPERCHGARREVRGRDCETAARRVFWRSGGPGCPGHRIDSPGQDP